MSIDRLNPRAAFLTLGALLLVSLGAASPARAQGTWQFCAVQDEICRVNGQALVRYGAGGRYAYKSVRNRIICDQLEFGDPAFGVPKRCEFSTDNNPSPGAPLPGGWTPCASEGETCNFSGAARVRYGVDNSYVYRNASNAIRCSVSIFGDPAFGRHKTCDYQLHAYAGPANPQGGWEYCASEGGTCHFNGPGEVRYGARGKFVTLRAVNGLPCGLETFGRDPIYGQEKQCFVRLTR